MADLSSHLVHQPFGNRQTKPAAFGCRQIARLQTLKLAEQMGTLRRSDAWSGVAHLEPHFLSVRSLAEAQFDGTRRRELHGVAEQVDHHLPHPRCVREHVREAVRHRRQADRKPFRLGVRHHQFEAGPSQLRQIDVGRP